MHLRLCLGARGWRRVRGDPARCGGQAGPSRHAMQTQSRARAKHGGGRTRIARTRADASRVRSPHAAPGCQTRGCHPSVHPRIAPVASCHSLLPEIRPCALPEVRPCALPEVRSCPSPVLGALAAQVGQAQAGASGKPDGRGHQHEEFEQHVSRLDGVDLRRAAKDRQPASTQVLEEAPASQFFVQWVKLSQRCSVSWTFPWTRKGIIVTGEICMHAIQGAVQSMILRYGHESHRAFLLAKS